MTKSGLNSANFCPPTNPSKAVSMLYLFSMTNVRSMEWTMPRSSSMIKIFLDAFSAAENASKKILIIDDDRGIVHSIERTFVMENKYSIETAFDGFVGGQKFAEFKPDLVILDIHMP